MSTRKIIIIAAFVCCVLVALTLMVRGVADDRLAHDYAVYWRAANEQAADAYSARHEKPFPYAPTMLLWIAPLGLVSGALGYAILSIGGVAGFVFACRPYLSKTAIALTLISGPMVRCVRNGQVTAILTALLIWSCGTANRVAAGVALGIIASIKPQLVIMAPVMLALNRDWRAFVAAALTFVFIVALAVGIFGAERWPEWFTSMTYFRHVLIEGNVAHIGITPALVAEYYGLSPLPFLIAGAMAGGALVFLCRNAGPLEQATAIGAGSLLAAPYALTYDLVVILPFAALKIMEGRPLSIFSIAAMFNPLPLMITGYELVRQHLSANDLDQEPVADNIVGDGRASYSSSSSNNN